jgi:hypothetical protein
MRTRGKSGLSLLEVLFATAIMGAVISMVYVILHRSTQRFGNEMVHLALEERARETLLRVARDLREAGEGTLRAGDPPVVPLPGQAYHDLRFGVITGYDFAGREARFGESVRYRWVPDPADPVNGRDDDGNGTVDDGWVELTDRRGRTSRICSHVTAQGLSFKVEGAVVTVTLDLERRDADGRPVRGSAVKSIELRNRP